MGLLYHGKEQQKLKKKTTLVISNPKTFKKSFFLSFMMNKTIMKLIWSSSKKFLFLT